MVKKIERDRSRFRQIVRGKVKAGLRKYMSHGELIGKKGKDLVSIPLPQIDLPRFKYGSNRKEGAGQGDGEPGTPIGKADGEGGVGGAGENPGEHILEVEVTMEELAEIMAEELELPRIKPKGKRNIIAKTAKYTGISLAGPESLRHFKRTYKQALKRHLITGTYDPRDPIIIPVREDKRYRSWKATTKPETNAIIVYMMDVSGSMGDEQKEIVRIESFWIDTWLRSQYDGLESIYIIHDAVAREVDQETFYHTRESGGTRISSAYSLSRQVINDRYDPAEWNLYLFHFSDGDNWSGGDTEECIKILETELLPRINLFCYGQVHSPYGSGKFLKDLQSHFENSENLVVSEIQDRDAIYDSIKIFLGKGK